MKNVIDGVKLSDHQSLNQIIAHMNVYSQHKKAMAETVWPDKETDNIKKIKIMKKG